MRYHVYEIVTVTDDVIHILLDEDDYFVVVDGYSDLVRLSTPEILINRQTKAEHAAMVLNDDKSVECINMNVTLKEAIKIIEFNKLISG